MAIAAEGGSAASLPDATPRDWARKYPPLVALAVGLIIMLAVMPSALNLPQSNPQETTEYAPVPPKDQDNSNDSNQDSLGLAGSASIGGAGAPGGNGPGGPPPLTPTTRATKDAKVQCYGNPPRQTEDPLSPPCVGYFNGDNYGATYLGVTGESVRILFYLDGGITYVGASDTSAAGAPNNKCFDLAKPPDPKQPTEHLTVKSLRVWQAFFNNRFQTYRRRVFFTVCFGGSVAPETRRQDAVNHFNAWHPFATVLELTEGFEDDYIGEMARKGVLNFGSFGVRPASLFQQYPKLIWSYLPSVEQQAESYASYICRQVVPFKSALAGPDLNNQTRRLGMIRTTDEKQQGLIKMAKIVKEQVTKCGGNFVTADATYSYCCIARGNSASAASEENQIAQFRAAGVTTIIWPGGINPHYGRAAANIGYAPEWIVAGDTILDASYPVVFSDHAIAFDQHAIVVTPQPFQPALQNQRCYEAYRSVDQTTPDSDLQYTCNYYRDLFQLFVGIQVAGPRLGPSSVDKGFHAIPQRYESTDPQTPSCFYLPDDYTCVKDGAAQFFDAQGVPPGANQPGCWRGIESGQRYAPNQWPKENINARIKGNEPCSGYNARVRYNIS